MFSIGDRVRLITNEYEKTWKLPKGSIGTIVSIKEDFNVFTVRFDDWYEGHDGDMGDENASSYKYCDAVDLELIKSEPNSHYDTRIQPIETMQANMTPEEFQGYCKGNIIKYACRCGRKDEPLKEALKIVDYANWLVLSLKGEIINPHTHMEGREVKEG